MLFTMHLHPRFGPVPEILVLITYPKKPPLKYQSDLEVLSLHRHLYFDNESSKRHGEYVYLQGLA